jgi:hypothetical protein
MKRRAFERWLKQHDCELLRFLVYPALKARDLRSNLRDLCGNESSATAP